MAAANSGSVGRGKNTTSELSRHTAAKAWCTPETSHIEMNVTLAEAFAAILDEIWSKPWLGNATTLELLNELSVRAEVGGYGNYKTVNTHD